MQECDGRWGTGVFAFECLESMVAKQVSGPRELLMEGCATLQDVLVAGAWLLYFLNLSLMIVQTSPRNVIPPALSLITGAQLIQAFKLDYNLPALKMPPSLIYIYIYLWYIWYCPCANMWALAFAYLLIHLFPPCPLTNATLINNHLWGWLRIDFMSVPRIVFLPIQRL